jgi:hypothetical protein
LLRERSEVGGAREPTGQSENPELLETESNHFFFFARRCECQSVKTSGAKAPCEQRPNGTTEIVPFQNIHQI